MAAFLETLLAIAILCNVVCYGLGVEVARKLGKHLYLLRQLWGLCQRRAPQLCDAILKFAEIWDSFTSSTLDFEDRFAIFCDQLGDLLEALVQRLVDWLEYLFQLDAAEHTAALSRVPRHRVTEEESRQGVGRLRVTSCAICLEEWEEGDDVRSLPACAHAFHSNCVDAWIYRRQQCPVCRMAIAL